MNERDEGAGRRARPFVVGNDLARGRGLGCGDDSEAIDELVLPIERAGRSEPCNLDDRTAREARKLFGQLIARR